MKIAAGMLIATALIVAGAGSAMADQDRPEKGQAHLKGERTITGTIVEVRANELKVSTGELQPRFLPVKTGKDKGLESFKPGDTIEITLNEQNLIVDYHRPGEGGTHKIVKGRLAETLVIGHDQALIETAEGKRQEYGVQSQVRSKLAAVPPGVDAEFMIDETNKISDVNFGRASAQVAAKDPAPNPIKGAHRRIEARVVALDQDRLTVRTSDGTETAYEIRPSIKDKLAKTVKGDVVYLMLDKEGQLIDLAFPPKG